MDVDNNSAITIFRKTGKIVIKSSYREVVSEIQPLFKSTNILVRSSGEGSCEKSENQIQNKF